MQTPYQHLGAPQAVALPVAAAPASSGECCPCCVEPGCCSRVGACPCFCSGYTAAFSVALSSIWLALPMLGCAVGVPDLFDITQWWDYQLSLGMWQLCDDQRGGCTTYSGLQADSAVAMFNAMRILAVISTAFTLFTGILGAVRLARMQRSKPNSNTLNNVTLASALIALASAVTSFGLTFPLNSVLANGNNDSRDYWGYASSFGAAWVMLTVGMGLLVVGVALHLVAHCCYQYSAAASSASAEDASDQPGLYAVHGYSASASVFSHPQPLRQPVVFYPTATVQYPAAPYAQPAMIYQ